MANQCPYLEYRPLSTGDETGGRGETGETGETDASDGAPRPFCTAAEEFVQPMRADICNHRYGLDPETDCEIFRDHEGLPEMPGEGGAGGESE